MEHDGRRLNPNLDIDQVLSDLAQEPEGFDSFLERRVSECISHQVPASELSEIAVARDSVEIKLVESVVESSESDSSTETSREIELPNGSLYAPSVGEKHAELILHEHPIVGSYITETSKGFSVDEEWQKVFIQTRQIAVQELTAEQIIERFHKNERAVFLIRAQQQGLRLALEDVLQTKNWREREALLELDRKERARANKKKVKEGEKPAKSASKPGSKAKTKSMKTIDTLASMMMDRPAIEKKLTELGLLDSDARVYLGKKFV